MAWWELKSNCSTGTQGRPTVVCLLETCLRMDTFLWFCACSVGNFSDWCGQGNKEWMKSAEQQFVGDCYCCGQLKEVSTAEVTDLLGFVKKAVLLTTVAGELEVTVAEALRLERLLVCGLCLWRFALELERFPGWWLLHIFLYCSRSVSVRGLTCARGVRKRLGISVLVP